MELEDLGWLAAEFLVEFDTDKKVQFFLQPQKASNVLHRIKCPWLVSTGGLLEQTTEKIVLFPGFLPQGDGMTTPPPAPKARM